MDQGLGNDVSKILYNAARRTWATRAGKIGDVTEPFEDFSGIKLVDIGGLAKGSYLGLGFDGVGTKVELAERTAKHDTVAHDLFAMACDDAVAKGLEPAIIGSVLDLSRLRKDDPSHVEMLKALARGYMDAAMAANVAIINGEAAQLGYRVAGYGEFNYNWSAGLVSFARSDRIITGQNVGAGDSIVALREEGLRSNGMTDMRETMEAEYGQEWHMEESSGRLIAQEALRPSVIYTRAVVDMHGGFDGDPRARINGIAHITGGGIPEKLGRVLKVTGLGAELYDLFDPNWIMIYCQSLSGMSDHVAYRTWNMGQGMLVMTPEPQKVVDIAGEHGIESKVAGEITHKPGIRIRSKGYDSNPIELSFKA